MHFDSIFHIILIVLAFGAAGCTGSNDSNQLLPLPSALCNGKSCISDLQLDASHPLTKVQEVFNQMNTQSDTQFSNLVNDFGGVLSAGGITKCSQISDRAEFQGVSATGRTISMTTQGVTQAGKKISSFFRKEENENYDATFKVVYGDQQGLFQVKCYTGNSMTVMIRIDPSDGDSLDGNTVTVFRDSEGKVTRALNEGIYFRFDGTTFEIWDSGKKYNDEEPLQPLYESVSAVGNAGADHIQINSNGEETEPKFEDAETKECVVLSTGELVDLTDCYDDDLQVVDPE